LIDPRFKRGTTFVMLRYLIGFDSENETVFILLLT